MYEKYYGFTEKPFSLTPDPKFLFRSETHAGAFELLEYAMQRREGFVVITGDIGTGKTTLCRALLERLDRQTFSALLLNPFLSETDLLRLILQDFGVVSRDEFKRGYMGKVTKQALIDTLNDFLLSLLPLGACAMVIIDEAQHLPRQVLEQIRILSNLETAKEKLLQIVLVGQPDLTATLRAPELRQLAQRVSIKHELRPLTQDEVTAYVIHRLTVAGGAAAVTFRPQALATIHRLSHGIPRVINLLCDRALLASYGARANVIDADVVRTASASLDLPEATPPVRRVRSRVRRRGVPVAVAVALTALVGIASAGLGYLVAEGYRVRVTDRFPLVAVERPFAAPTVTADTDQIASPITP
jgi:general secretion pathway protein A